MVKRTVLKTVRRETVRGFDPHLLLHFILESYSSGLRGQVANLLGGHTYVGSNPTDSSILSGISLNHGRATATVVRAGSNPAFRHLIMSGTSSTVERLLS